MQDGNGRLSRLLASIPLLRQHLPPLTVAVPWQNKYYHALNWVRSEHACPGRAVAEAEVTLQTRANGDGDYGVLMKLLFQATQAAMDELRELQTSVRLPDHWQVADEDAEMTPAQSL